MKLETAISELNATVLECRSQVVIDAEISRITSVFRSASAREREGIQAVSPAARTPLLSYAWCAAEDAIRHSSPSFILSGLVALVIEGGFVDIRDSIMRLAVLYHSAIVLKMDTTKAFGDIAEMARNPRLAEEMRAFPSRSANVRDLAAFWIGTSGSAGGFRYEFQGARLRSKSLWRRILAAVLRKNSI